MSEQTAPTQRFTLDEAQARKWLERVTAIHDADNEGTELPEGIAPREDGEELPEFGSDWNPVDPGQENEVYQLVHLVHLARYAGAIGCPAGTELEFEYIDDSDGGYCYFLVYTGHQLKLATHGYEMRELGERDAAGVTAAMAILDEAVSSANWVLTHLDEYVASRQDTTLADEWTADGEPLPGTPDECGECGTGRYGNREVDLDATPACPVTGYRYGSAWLAEELPEGFADELTALLPASEDD